MLVGTVGLATGLTSVRRQGDHPAVNRRQVARLRLFDDGAPALRRTLERQGRGQLLPASGDFYACPCCLRAYPREAAAAGWLTEEHVPPDRLGGRRLVLTCRPCNSTSGQQFDAHAVIRSQAEDFVRGRPTGPLPVTFHAGGIPLRGTAQRTEDGGIQAFGVPRQNDPKVAAAHWQALDEYVDRKIQNPDVSFTLHTVYDEARARISWIRSAYLAAFAGLGWSYILRPVMQPIRDQLTEPESAILPTHMLRSLGADPGVRRILLVEQPEELRCVAVVMGEFTVFLPGIYQPRGYQEIVEAVLDAKQRQRQEGVTLDMNGKEVPWPRTARYSMD